MAAKERSSGRNLFKNLAGYFVGGGRQAMVRPYFSNRPHQRIDILPTGIRSLDKAVDYGGLPCGRITELSSHEKITGGSTCLAARLAAHIQRKQQSVDIIDLGRNFDLALAQRVGLAAPHLLTSRPDTIFEALTRLEQAALKPGLIIVAMGSPVNLFAPSGPSRLRTLLGRLRAIIRPSPAAFLFMTTLTQDNPFSPANYPPGFPLGELADLRLWIQDAHYTFKDGAVSACKTTVTVIHNRLAQAGKGAVIRIKLEPVGPG